MVNIKMIHTVADILRYADIPFQLIVPDERRLKILSNGGTTFGDSVTYRFDATAPFNHMCVSLNDEPQPAEPPEGTAIISGTGYAFNGVIGRLDIELDNGGRYHVYLNVNPLAHFRKTFKTGDWLKLRVRFTLAGLEVTNADDVLEHTREEITAINLKE